MDMLNYSPLHEHKLAEHKAVRHQLEVLASLQERHQIHLDEEAVYQVLEADYNLFMDVQHAINLQLVRTFAEHGIQFALPTRTLHLGAGLVAPATVP